MAFRGKYYKRRRYRGGGKRRFKRRGIRRMRIGYRM